MSKQASRYRKKKTQTMRLRTPHKTILAPPLVIDAAGQRFKHTTQLLYLGGIIHGTADLSDEIDRRIRLVPACLRRFGPELYDRTTASLSLKVRMPKAEVMETVYGRATWTLERNTLPSFEGLTTKSFRESLASSTDFVLTTPPSRTRRPSR